MLFEMGKEEAAIDIPMIRLIRNKNKRIVELMLNIYSMDSFVYQDLNKACRLKDHNYIPYFGPFAAALSLILYFSNSDLKDDRLEGTTVVYRGLKVT